MTSSTKLQLCFICSQDQFNRDHVTVQFILTPSQAIWKISGESKKKTQTKNFSALRNIPWLHTWGCFFLFSAVEHAQKFRYKNPTSCWKFSGLWWRPTRDFSSQINIFNLKNNKKINSPLFFKSYIHNYFFFYCMVMQQLFLQCIWNSFSQQSNWLRIKQLTWNNFYTTPWMEGNFPH